MVKISADSTCDLSQELIQRYAITVQPLYITKDDRSFLDGVEIFPEDIFAACGAAPVGFARPSAVSDGGLHRAV